MTYFIVSWLALTRGWTTPWIWAARPPHDHGAGLCAALVFAIGAVAFSVIGADDHNRERPAR